MSDNRWSAVAALAYAAGAAFVDRRKTVDPVPELHERIALLEAKLDRFEAWAETLGYVR